MPEGNVKVEIHGKVSVITFTHPAHNSMPGYQLKALTEAIQDAGNDPGTNVILVKSGGDRTFCAGASFEELAAIDNLEDGRKFFMGFANVINACRTSPKLIVGRVQGKAVGGGVGLAAAMDYCFATKYASVKLSELALGIGPFVVGPAVERKIGASAFSQLAINASAWQTAEWALSMGLYAEVYETTENMDVRVDEFCRHLASMHMDALRELKHVFWQGTAHWDDLLRQRAEVSGRLVLSDFTKSAIASVKTRK